VRSLSWSVAACRLAFAHSGAQPRLPCRPATPARPCDQSDPPAHALVCLSCQLRSADRLALVFLISALPRSPITPPEPAIVVLDDRSNYDGLLNAGEITAHFSPCDIFARSEDRPDAPNGAEPRRAAGPD